MGGLLTNLTLGENRNMLLIGEMRCYFLKRHRGRRKVVAANECAPSVKSKNTLGRVVPGLTVDAMASCDIASSFE